jgi:hypothetical protein
MNHVDFEAIITQRVFLHQGASLGNDLGAFPDQLGQVLARITR